MSNKIRNDTDYNYTRLRTAIDNAVERDSLLETWVHSIPNVWNITCAPGCLGVKKELDKVK